MPSKLASLSNVKHANQFIIIITNQKESSVSNCDRLVAKATENGLLATRLSIPVSTFIHLFIYFFALTILYPQLVIFMS